MPKGYSKASMYAVKARYYKPKHNKIVVGGGNINVVENNNNTKIARLLKEFNKLK